jgi:dephospho-CoA kinase
VIGLTGGIASGKSTVAEMLRQRGAAVIDADRLGHRVLEPGSEGWHEVVTAFGPEVLAPDGSIDRKRLGALVFANPVARQRLNAISHPRIRAMAEEAIAQLRQAGTVPLAVLDAALLFEAGWDDLCDEVWVVSAPEEVALERLVSRNGLSVAAARERFRAQLPVEEKRARGDVVIENSGTLAELERQVEAVWQQALQRASSDQAEASA